MRKMISFFAFAIFLLVVSTSISEAKVGKSNKKSGVAKEQPASSASAASEGSAALKEAISQKVKKELQKSGFKNGDVGIWVGARSEIGAIETYFEQNSDKRMIPASLSKLATLGAVLHDLHPGYKYKTTLVTSAKLRDGTLTGPLYLKGGGDPSFVSENMWILVNELTRAGVSTVDGDILVDDSRFDDERWGDDRQEERVDRAYDAPVGAMSMNWNSVSVYVRPGDAVGEKLKVFADVMSPYIKVRNETKTVATGRGKTVSVERVSEKGFDGDVLVVSGAMAEGLPEAVFYKNITQPDIWSGHCLIEFLRQRGISVKGKVRTGTAPKDAKILATAESKPLSLIVADMAKWSNNYVAEMLVKNLAAEAKEGAQGNMTSGMQRVTAYLESAGLKKGEYEFVNAAGFTRKNKLSPEQIGRILEHVRSDFSIFPEYLAALPIAGVDGTLRNRMKSSSAERWVRAKTGLLNGVVGLAGYAGKPSGMILAFAFIYNGAGHEDRARATFDQIAAKLVED